MLGNTNEWGSPSPSIYRSDQILVVVYGRERCAQPSRIVDLREPASFVKVSVNTAGQVVKDPCDDTRVVYCAREPAVGTRIVDVGVSAILVYEGMGRGAVDLIVADDYASIVDGESLCELRPGKIELHESPVRVQIAVVSQRENIHRADNVGAEPTDNLPLVVNPICCGGICTWVADLRDPTVFRAVDIALLPYFRVATGRKRAISTHRNSVAVDSRQIGVCATWGLGGDKLRWAQREKCWCHLNVSVNSIWSLCVTDDLRVARPEWNCGNELAWEVSAWVECILQARSHRDC